jgi:exo-beta-1,3-glucanase (GH17 family)/cellulose synthase/poly-beta-1,6-N-acetylglucosamine synthase-like glycosyltransferase
MQPGRWNVPAVKWGLLRVSRISFSRLPRLLAGGGVRIALALLLVVGASVLFWASRDYTVIAPDWDGQIRGIAYSPSHLFSQRDHELVAPAEIDRDLAQLSQLTGHIRTYTVDNGLDKVPEIARRYGLTVTLGIWIGSDLDKNEEEIKTAIKAALANRRVVDRVVVGNEAILRGDVTADQLNDYIKRVRAALPARIKITTAEPWSMWLLTPEIGQYVDVVFVHLLPYWEGVDARNSLTFVQHAFQDVQDEFPDKPIVIGETGWPSEGRTRRGAEANIASEAYFDRAFVQLAVQKGYDYYIVEAYDQPWKVSNEGAVGAYWGLLNANGKPKFSFTGLLRSFPQWRFYALLGAILTLTLGLLILGRMPRLKQPGYLVMGALVALVTTGLLVLIDATALEYIDPGDIAMIAAMSPLVLLASTVILTEGVELAASLWRVERRQVLASIPESSPRISIHVPCYNEPPQMVIETLDALARLDHDNYQVIVLDNNTPDPETWRPVEAHCKTLGPRFIFHHMDQVQGFKAGALNEMLKLTDPSAEYVAVIDSDYQVEPSWLRRALPLFALPDIALVQGPQDYRDAGLSAFKAMAYEEYRGFFHIGMVERNEHNAIIQHGTMTIVRRRALDEVGGWATWCITEDTELGLKLFEAGYGAAYISGSMGSGLMPDTLEAFMSQRYRWVYGAMQIMKRHAGPIFLGRRKLSWAQRYQFLSGWLPWMSDGLGMIVTFMGLIWTALMTALPTMFDVPMPALSAAALALFFAKTLKTLLLYPQKVRSGVKGAIMASVAGLSLTHTVGKAALTGLFTSGKPFLRTPKCEDPAMLSQALRVVWQETLLFSLCILAVGLMAFVNNGLDDPAAMLWMTMLSVQALPYAASVATAAISATSNARKDRANILPALPPAPTPPEPEPLPKAA